jgi:hypothetical protein
MSDERQSTLTAEEIAERVRARKQRQRWGGWVFVVGLLAGLAAAFWLRDLALTTLFLGVGLVGAGFADPQEIRGFWK